MRSCGLRHFLRRAKVEFGQLLAESNFLAERASFRRRKAFWRMRNDLAEVPSSSQPSGLIRHHMARARCPCTCLFSWLTLYDDISHIVRYRQHLTHSVTFPTYFMESGIQSMIAAVNVSVFRLFTAQNSGTSFDHLISLTAMT